MVNISIIIVNYNSFQMLKECLDSILKLTTELTYEIIIVDNGSIEGNIRECLFPYQNVRLITNKSNVGFSTANNMGIKIAIGEFVLFLNNDTLFLENSLKKILHYIKDKNSNSVIGCRLLNQNRTHQSSVVDKDSISNSFGENFFLYKLFPRVRMLNKYYFSYKEPKEPTVVDVVKGAFIFCSKKIVDELNGFDERFFFYAEETDFCLKAKELRYNVIYFPQTEIIHLGGVATDKDLWFKFKNQSIAKIQIYQKHFKGIEFFLLTAFHYLGVFLRVFVYMVMSLLKLKENLFKKSFIYFRLLFIYPKNQFK
ncbi:MAG: glycosyltransferase family 2 protein [Ignavibacteriaceae bacterium]